MPPYEWKRLVRIFLHSKVGQEGCWIWPYGKTTQGYGLITVDGKRVYAHRYVYSLFNILDPDLEICHSCDTPSCIKPTDLFQGTHRENMMDLAVKGLNRASKLTMEQVLQIRRLKGSSLSYREIGRRFGVTHTAVTQILRGETYTHIKDKIVEDV